MNKIFGGMFNSIKRKKGYFIILLLLSVVAVVLGVIAAINFGGGIFDIDLSNIAYIRFLKGNCGFMSMMFGLILSLLVFLVVILICHWKSFLLPLGIVFYLYLVYSQAVIFVGIITIYGFLNCIILAVLLLVYSLLIWSVFLIIMCELSCLVNSHNYFKSCFSIRESNIILFLIFILILTLIFSLILMILKNYVILLIF
jgi:hypothetical protein